MSKSALELYKLKKAPKVIEYNPANDPERMHGYQNVRWVENVSDGLRLVGFADEIVRRIDHRGWYYIDEYIGEVYRGVVYQLPARNGQPLFVYGYADPCNDDCALLCFFDVNPSKEEAARQADRFAEIFAEHEREYQAASSARSRFDDLEVEIKERRKEALDLGKEMREAKGAKLKVPAICTALREKVLSIRRLIQKLRDERAELKDNYGRHEGWAQ